MLALAFRPRMGSAAFQRPAGEGTTVHLSHAHFSVLCWLKRKAGQSTALRVVSFFLVFFFKCQKHFRNMLAIKLSFFLHPQIRLTESLHSLMRCCWFYPFACLYLTAKVSNLTLA